MVLRVAVAGASGYAGGELVRLIEGHPEFQLDTVTANSNVGKQIGEVHPHLPSVGLELKETTVDVLNGHDVVFLALPHGKSGEFGDAIDARLVVDCGADHRLERKDDWMDYYPGYPGRTWTYGMPELWGQWGKIAESSRIAVPGCNATAVTLGFAPLVQQDLIETTDLVSVLAVGVSGAGKSLREDLLASEVLGSASAYAVGGTHRHNPEILQNLRNVAEHNFDRKQDFALSFTPILVPMSRGILATNTATVRDGVTLDDIRLAFLRNFSIHQFISMLPEERQPRTADVLGSNSAHIQVALDERARRVVVTVAIDNLGKGTAGAAIQSANIALGLDHALGLSRIGVAP